jgi:glycerol uptake facilitator-like aquaporin
MPSLAQRAFCEALGTAFLLAAVVGSGIMAQQLAGGNGALALLCNTIPTGAILAVLILVFGAISGAHFNPAVSLGFALRRKLAWPIAGLYIIVQVLGGIAGVWTAHLMFEQPVWQMSITARTGQGQWLAEAVATFGLLLTVFGCVARRPSPSRTPSASTSPRPTGSRLPRPLPTLRSRLPGRFPTPLPELRPPGLPRSYLPSLREWLQRSF